MYSLDYAGHSSETSPSTQGRLCIVDLAGSERLKETQSTNHTLRETGFINKSLYTLGKVINGIAQRGQSRGGGQRREKTSKASVPFRDSVLTKLLISSLGGECMTIMMSCVSPATEAVTESVRTLSFAMRVKGIQNHPTLHVDQQEKMLVDLKKEIDKLKRENVKLREMVVEVQEEAKLGLGKSSNGHIGLVSEMVEWKAEVGVEVQPIKELQPQPPQPVDNDNDVYHDDEFLVEDDDENERSTLPKTPPFKSTKAIFSASPQKTQFVAHGSKLEKLERLLLESRAVVESGGGEVGKGVEEIEEEIAELKLELLLTTQLAGLGLDEDEDEDEDEREDEDEEEAAAEKLLEEQLRNLMGGKGGGDEIDDSDSGGEHSHSDDNLVSSEEESGGDWRSKWQENLERMEARGSATEQYEGGDEFEFPVDENFLSPPRNLFGQQQQQQQQQHYHQQQQQQHHLPQIKNRKKFFRGGTGGAGVAIYRQENRGLDRKLSKSLQNKNARKRQKF